ncbi:putative phospholipid-transporting ATPase IB [Gossypium arboreum]|uniref:Putative phospholipid-transporting ATPase IB n=1 Tax=Gossypium arboreum TaxID=29729 RepID=A0A0B0PFV8_GOSAR|nr:putative phospholipid-transporting ATPase IB [Gossypium arboreum]
MPCYYYLIRLTECMFDCYYLLHAMLLLSDAWDWVIDGGSTETMLQLWSVGLVRVECSGWL